MDQKAFERLLRTTEPDPLTPADFAFHAGTDRHLTEDLISRGQIKTVLVDNQRLLPFSSLERFIMDTSRNRIARIRSDLKGMAVCVKLGLAVNVGTDGHGHTLYKAAHESLDQIPDWLQGIFNGR